MFLSPGKPKKKTNQKTHQHLESEGMMHDACFFHEGIVSFIFLVFASCWPIRLLFHFPEFSTKKRCWQLAPDGCLPFGVGTSPFFADIFGMPEQKPASLGTWSFCAGELLSPTTFDSRGWDWKLPLLAVWNFLVGEGKFQPWKMTCWSCVLLLLLIF